MLQPLLQPFVSPGSVPIHQNQSALAIHRGQSGVAINMGPATLEDYQALKQGFDSVMHLMIAKVLFATGLRIGEVLKLQPRFTSLTGPDYAILVKRSKKRIRKSQPEYDPVFLPPSLGMELLAYIQGNGIPVDAPIFQGRTPGKAISVRGVEYAFDRASERAFRFGLTRRMHPHDLRHIVVKMLRDNGVPMEAVSRFVGHEDVKTTTQWYWDMSVDQRRAIGERMPV